MGKLVLAPKNLTEEEIKKVVTKKLYGKKKTEPEFKPNAVNDFFYACLGFCMIFPAFLVFILSFFGRGIQGALADALTIYHRGME